MIHEEKFYTLAVVGGGPAGLSAALTGASEGLGTILVECGKTLGGQAKYSSRIENYLGFPTGLTGPALISRAAHQATKFGAHFVCGFKVVELRREGRYHVLCLSDGRLIVCKAVVVASGLQWRKLKGEGVDKLHGRGVYYGASMGDAARYAGQSVVIVGGANSAGQAALFFSHICQVTMLVRGGSIEDSMSHYLVSRIERNERIKVVTEATLTKVLGDDVPNGILVNHAGAEEELPAAALFIFIGAEPRTKWLVGACNVDDRGFVVTDENKRTDCPGVFCAGDVRLGSMKRIASGVGEGAHSVAMVHEYLAGW